MSWATPFSGITFIYNSDNSSPGKPSGLNVDRWGSTPGTQIIVYPWGGGAANELWTVDDAGHMFPASCSGMAAGLGDALDGQQGFNVVLVNYDKSDASQNWFFDQSSNQILNQSATAQGWPLAVQNGNVVCVPPNSAYASGYEWTTLPCPSINGAQMWYFIQEYGMPNDNDSINYGLNVSGNSTAPGTPVILYEWQGGKSNELWQLQSNGTIRSKLSVGNSGGDIMLYSVNNAAVTGPDIEPPIILDTWGTQDYVDPSNQQPYKAITRTTQEGALQLLTASGTFPTDSASILAVENSGDPTVGQKWMVLQSNLFYMLLAMPPQPFRVFSGNKQKALADYVPTVLGINTPLRSQYTNLVETSTFGIWINALKSAQCPPYLGPAEWGDLCRDLETEMSQVPSVQMFFSFFQDQMNKLNPVMNANTNAIVSLGGMTQSSTTVDWGDIVLTLFEGIAYTLLNLPMDEDAKAPAIIANAMEAVINTYLATSITTTGGGGYKGAVAHLWDLISKIFSDFSAAASNYAWTILSDGGKTEAAYNLTTANSIYSLVWDPNADITPSAMPGFNLFVMQNILPSKWQVKWETVDSDTTDLSKGIWATVLIISGMTQFSFVELDGSDTPGDQLFTDPDVGLFSQAMSGVVQPQEVFLSQNGWVFNLTPPIPMARAPKGGFSKEALDEGIQKVLAAKKGKAAV